MPMIVLSSKGLMISRDDRRELQCHQQWIFFQFREIKQLVPKLYNTFMYENGRNL
jgi:hypothetical protein